MADGREAWRQLLDAVAVAHPDVEAARRASTSSGSAAGQLDLGVAVLAVVGGLDGAAELRGHACMP